jgi:ABC-type sugar transport system substrate-binding protein
MSCAKLPLLTGSGASGASQFRPLALALLVAGLAVGVTACGSSDADKSSSSSGGGAEGGGSVKGKNVAVVSVAETNPWAAVFNKVVKKKLTAEGAKVSVTGDTDPAGQVQLLNQAVSEHPDLIVLEALDSKAVAPAIAKAKAQKIPVLNADGKADPSVSDGLNQVLSDNVALGRFAAQNIVEGLQKSGKKSGKIGVITGTAAMLLTQERMQGFRNVLREHPGYKVVFEEDGNWDPVKSGDIATRMFAKFGKGGLDAAYGMADYMAVPIVTAAKQAGIPVGLKGNGLIVTGGNCFKIGIEAIKSGEMYGTATEDPGTLAEEVSAYASKMLKGEDVPLTQTVKEARVSPKTLEKYAEQCSKA